MDRCMRIAIVDKENTDGIGRSIQNADVEHLGLPDEWKLTAEDIVFVIMPYDTTDNGRVVDRLPLRVIEQWKEGQLIKHKLKTGGRMFIEVNQLKHERLGDIGDWQETIITLMGR